MLTLLSFLVLSAPGLFGTKGFLGLFFFFVVLLISLNTKKLMLILIYLEVASLTLLLIVASDSSMAQNLVLLFMSLLTFAAIESALGLSVLTSMSRQTSLSLPSSFSLNKLKAFKALHYLISMMNYKRFPTAK